MRTAWRSVPAAVVTAVAVMAAMAMGGCRKPPDSCCGQPAGVACAGPMDPGGGVRSAIRTEPPRSGAVGANACTTPAVVPSAVGGGPRAPGNAAAGQGEGANLRFEGSPRRAEY